MRARLLTLTALKTVDPARLQRAVHALTENALAIPLPASPRARFGRWCGMAREKRMG